MVNHPLTQSFVDPNICQELVDAGLKITAPYCWLHEFKKYTLYSLAFDEDDYYEPGYQAKIQLGASFIPAFQIEDMQQLLPDWLLNKNNNEFELHCSSLFSLDIEKAGRIPDAFAKMVLKAILKRKIDVAHAIKTITI